MSKVLVCKDDENLLLTRSKAHKFNKIDLTEIGCGKSFEFEAGDDSIVGVPAEQSDNLKYTIVTKEFGLYAMKDKVSAKVKVRFCDDGMMVIDLIEGAVLIKPEDDVLLASVGVSELPSVVADNILWIDADKLLAYRDYWKGFKSSMVQDFEYMFILKGERISNTESFGVRLLNDETIDISGGYIAALEADKAKKEAAKKVQKGFAEIIAGSSVSGYSFDDDDDYDEDESEEDEYEDDDYDDGSNY